MTDLVSLADVKKHLRYPNTNADDDMAIMGFIAAADEVIQQECGRTIANQYDEYYDGGDMSIYLRHLPLLTIVNVEEGWGYMNYELVYQQSNTVPAPSMFAYSIENLETGELSRRTAGNVAIPFIPGQGNIRVTYTAGRDRIPATIRLAALELIAHWWQGSQQRGGGSAGSFDATDDDYTHSQGVTGINAGVPYRILEMLKPHRRMPFIG